LLQQYHFFYLQKKRIVRITVGIRGRDSCREYFRELKILSLQFQYIYSEVLCHCRELLVSVSCRELPVFGSCRELPVMVSSCKLNCSADGFLDNPSAQTPRKKGRTIVECLFTELLPSTGHGTDHRKPVT
jgi:hypothetical protein